MKRTKLFTLLLTLIMVAAMSQMVFANDYEANGSTYTYNGSDIVLTQGQSISEAVSQLEPGDTVKITLVYKNDTSDTTEWYMENTVLTTLEEEAEAVKDGGYTYVLSNIGPDGKETAIFDTRDGAIGGSDNKGGTGLKQATNATNGNLNSQDYFFIQELKAHESGKTVLTVGLDGESLANVYETRNARIQIGYAVEKLAEGETIYKHVKRNIDTGDTTDLIGPAAVFLGACLLLILAIISFRKDRKDGEDA